MRAHDKYKQIYLARSAYRYSKQISFLRKVMNNLMNNKFIKKEIIEMYKRAYDTISGYTKNELEEDLKIIDPNMLNNEIEEILTLFTEDSNIYFLTKHNVYAKYRKPKTHYDYRDDFSLEAFQNCFFILC